jgi:hypothetical protein
VKAEFAVKGEFGMTLSLGHITNLLDPMRQNLDDIGEKTIVIKLSLNGKTAAQRSLNATPAIHSK